MEQPQTERVLMRDLSAGDVIWTHGMRIRISGGKQHQPRPAYGDTTSWFHGDILNNFHPMGWKEREWAVQSADWVYWHREIMPDHK